MAEKTVIDYFEENVTKLGNKRFMTQPMGGGDANVQYFTYEEIYNEAKKMAGYIESLGFEPKSQIAICSKNCACNSLNVTMEVDGVECDVQS